MEKSNTGNRNTGNDNTGYRNTSNDNTGYRNTGNRNTGNRNTGYRNTGNHNTGYRNTGNRNTGNDNTGYRNTGNDNTGNRNTGDRNTGYLNTKSPTKGLLFNKFVDLWDSNGDLIIEIPAYFYFNVKTTEWVERDNMTEEEQTKYPGANTIGGFLRVYEISENLHKERKESFETTSKEDVKKTLELPGFDYTIFEEITGITKNDFDRKLGHTITGKAIKVTIDGVEYDAVIQ